MSARASGRGRLGAWRNWRESEPFAASDLRELQEARTQVPGATAAKLVAVSRVGIEDGIGVDATFDPAELLTAW